MNNAIWSAITITDDRIAVCIAVGICRNGGGGDDDDDDDDDDDE